MRDKLEKIIKAYEELEKKLSDPAVASDIKEFTRLNKEYAHQSDLIAASREYIGALDDIEAAKEMLHDTTDADEKEMLQMDISENEAKLPQLEEDIKYMLIPSDPNDDKNTIVEIRSAAGGDEAAIFAGDLYSATAKLETERREISSSVFFGQKCERYSLTEKSSGDLPEGGRLIAPLGEKILSYSVTEREGGLTVDGIVRADLLFRNGDNGITAVPSETPFSVEISCEGKARGVRVCLVDFAPRVRPDGIGTEFTIAVSFFDFGEKKISCIASVTETGERKRSDAAVSVFLPKAGDELWDVAKQLGEDGELIVKLNPGLSFPLTGKERILLYRRKD